MSENREPLQRKELMPANATLLYKLIKFKATGRYIDLWMSFPQKSCCFAFGPSEGPVLIGALFLLWSAGWPYLQECPECHKHTYMIAFGGLLSVGGGFLICPTCGYSWFQFLGGLATVATQYIQKSPLAQTEFRPTGALFGGAYSSDGEALRKFLGFDAKPEPGMKVSFTIELNKFSVPVGLELRSNRSPPRD
jgi:hypothetical protein